MPRRTDSARHKVLGGFLFSGFIVAAASQSAVQVFDRERVLSNAKKHAHFLIERVDMAHRGTIYSSDGKVVAQSVEGFLLGLNYSKVPASPGFFVSLSAATGVSATELADRPEKMNGRVWRKALTPEQAEAVRTIRRQWSADGVSLERSSDRFYPMSEVFAGVTGCQRSGESLNGLEKSQDGRLGGVDGESSGYVDRTGVFVTDPADPGTKPINGESITLTIDSQLQTAAMQALRAGVEANKAKSGAAVVIDPKTGEILAMVNWPTFDPNSGWKPGHDFNMAYMGVYEPGSTFKILTVAKALDSGHVSINDFAQCNGEIRVGDRTLHCDDHGGHRAHGSVSVEDAIARSCNVSAAQWALRIGRSDMISFMDSMEIFQKPRLGLPSERNGVFNRNDPGKRVQLATVGFGQSMACSPVNLAGAYSMLANNGVMMRPHVIRGENETVGQVVKPQTAETVMRLMESVIQSERGTGKALKIPGYRLAGKTGTAQKIGTAKDQYMANFVGYVPARDPRAVVLVMIDTPSAGQIYGGTVAGPVFVNIAKAVIRRFNIPS
ncbi:MAG: penicillin-binding protein 2, partial [Chthonomonadaceae bacterium]|nr:penicillin-binding protein 2 [Chthonomonadaceae bacterium]